MVRDFGVHVRPPLAVLQVQQSSQNLMHGVEVRVQGLGFRI